MCELVQRVHLGHVRTLRRGFGACEGGQGGHTG